MQNHTIQKNHSDNTPETGVHQHLFAAQPAFPCALPADVAQLRPAFMAEVEDHGNPLETR
jgi:hypothetical protein